MSMGANNNFKWTLTEIARLAEEIAKEENGQSFVYPQKQMFDLIEELCSCYINEESQGRENIRDSIHQIRGGVRLPGLIYVVPGAIYDFIKSVANKICNKNDSAWLEKGLAAASIEEGRMDSRDLYISLKELYESASAAGLDLNSYFNSMVEKSGNEGSKVLVNFLKSINK